MDEEKQKIVDQLKNELSIHTENDEPVDGMVKTKNGVLVTGGMLKRRREERNRTPKPAPEPELIPELPKKGRRKVQIPEPPPPPKHENKLLTLADTPLGDFPTYYYDVYKGTGVVVLVTTEQSFIPRRCVKTPTGLDPVFHFRELPGAYIYMGYNFKDAQGRNNIIIHSLEPEQNDG